MSRASETSQAEYDWSLDRAPWSNAQTAGRFMRKGPGLGQRTPDRESWNRRKGPLKDKSSGERIEDRVERGRNFGPKVIETGVLIDDSLDLVMMHEHAH